MAVLVTGAAGFIGAATSQALLDRGDDVVGIDAPKLKEASSSRSKRGMKSFVIMLNDQSGNTAAEYALIIALVGSAVALASISLGNTIAETFNGVANTIARCSASIQC